MRLLALSYPTEYKDEHAIINSLFENGLQIFHLRKPDWSLHQMTSLLDKIDARFHNRIIIHSHYEICNISPISNENQEDSFKKYQLKGIHFTHKTKHMIEKYKDLDLHKSISCHSFEEIGQYQDIMDYCFISPVFDSISKKGYKSAISLDDLKENAKRNNLVALGGINSHNIDQLKDLKLYGIALLGFLWESDDVLRSFMKIQNT